MGSPPHIPKYVGRWGGLPIYPSPWVHGDASHIPRSLGILGGCIQMYPSTWEYGGMSNASFRKQQGLHTLEWEDFPYTGGGLPIHRKTPETWEVFGCVKKLPMYGKTSMYEKTSDVW